MDVIKINVVYKKKKKKIDRFLNFGFSQEPASLYWKEIALTAYKSKLFDKRCDFWWRTVARERL